VAYAYVGIVTEDVTPSVARRLGLSVRQGAILVSVRRGTAAAHAGLRGGTRDLELNGRRIRAGGDVLVSIDGRPVASSEDVLRIVTEHLRPGKPATFTVVRDERRLNVRLVLDERPVNPNAG
jgi:2-alkenal reductase